MLFDSAPLGAGNHPLKLVVDVAGTSSAVAPPLIDLRWRTAVNGSLAIDTPSRAGSLNPDSNYLGLATSAGAAPASQSTDPKTVPLETFSAGGPVQVGSTTQCKRGAVGPCTGVAGSTVPHGGRADLDGRGRRLGQRVGWLPGPERLPGDGQRGLPVLRHLGGGTVGGRGRGGGAAGVRRPAVAAAAEPGAGQAGRRPR